MSGCSLQTDQIDVYMLQVMERMNLFGLDHLAGRR